MRNPNFEVSNPWDHSFQGSMMSINKLIIQLIKSHLRRKCDLLEYTTFAVMIFCSNFVLSCVPLHYRFLAVIIIIILLLKRGDH